LVSDTHPETIMHRSIGSPDPYDVIVIGSGPGGAFAALPLVDSGARVLMLEAGGWVPRGPWNLDPGSAAMLSPFYSKRTRYETHTDGGHHRVGQFQCVGGQSVFYGAVAFRYRAEDFSPPADVLGPSGACWPISYDELEPWYGIAEEVLGVSGNPLADPSEPRRTRTPASAASLTPTGEALHRAARDLGLHPFQPPLAITRAPNGVTAGCSACGRCDGHPCAAAAKGDAALLVASLVARGMALRTHTAALRLIASRDRVTRVECLDLITGQPVSLRAGSVVVASGALATPHLLLGSALQRFNPGGRVVGRYLTRHCNGVVVGCFREPPGGGRVPYKEIAIHDFYFGHSAHPELSRVGNIQQLSLPPAIVEQQAPWPFRPVARRLVPHLMGLIGITEDQPVATNGVTLDPHRTDGWGRPILRVHHRYTARDRLARDLLAREAARLLRAAGASITARKGIDTFSHALGTVRMGADPRSSALDAAGRFRGLTNLFVADGSALPTSAAVNPSLTIAANALRVGAGLAARRPIAFRTPAHAGLEVTHAAS
jgi:choline dehydrogenase-like flavoprotein